MCYDVPEETKEPESKKMAVLKCKLCGGTLRFVPGDTVCECEYCGTRQTLPKIDGEQRAKLYERAERFRRANEFDKAEALYEELLNGDDTDAEAYWCLVLCRWGVEYVEDPGTKKRVPTVNRAQFTSVFDDEDYQSALKYADPPQRELYRQEAEALNGIQKEILAVSQKEAPFDVFICYKETDGQGRRTPDSVLATDVYHRLTNEGLRVFFSRITLEDKLGTAYEPYIFAALNSAKVMVALGTKPEYFNAVWVKNEWSRYLKLVKESGGKKTLVPAYKDMDPYDLPKEFSHLQALDMGKLGFMQDLVHGIKKLIGENRQNTASENGRQTAGKDVAPLVKRVFLFLEDGDFNEAAAYCERILDLEPENALAYLGKLMADLHVKKRTELASLNEPFDDNKNYGKAVRFADEALRGELVSANARIRERTAFNKNKQAYDAAVADMKRASTENGFLSAARRFDAIAGFFDADRLAEECRLKAVAAKKNGVYDDALAKYRTNDVGALDAAEKLFRSIPGWKDADEMAGNCRSKIDSILLREREAKLELERREALEKQEARQRKKRKLRIAAIAAAALALCAGIVLLAVFVIVPSVRRGQAEKYLAEGKYEEAYNILSDLGDREAISRSKYERTKEHIKNGRKEQAFLLLEDLDYQDSARLLDEIRRVPLEEAFVGAYVTFGAYEQDNDTSNGKEPVEWRVLSVEYGRILVTSVYGLDCQPYHTEYEKVTWENCSLRAWLNNDFLNAAFTQAEREKIRNTYLSDEGKYNSDENGNISDQIFLLTGSECEDAFPAFTGLSSVRDMICGITDYAAAQGAARSDKVIADGKMSGRWWLRSIGDDPNNKAYYISDSGSLMYFGASVNDTHVAVRPAMWIETGSP